MKLNPLAYDFFKPNKVSDKQLLTGLLDFFVHQNVWDGYAFVFVPQLGENQGTPVEASRFRKYVPVGVQEHCKRIVRTHDIDEPSARTFKQTRNGHYQVAQCTIASVYDIDIGAIAITSKSSVKKRDISELLNVFEALISLRKRAVALSYHHEFLKLDQNHRASLDQAVGSIVHRAVNPNDTLIFALDETTDQYKVVYSHSGVSFSFPVKNDPISHAFRKREVVKINDASDVSRIAKLFGADFPNREFLNYRKYLSCICVPVYNDQTCYCVVACFFLRKNAVSNTEQYILQITCNILGDYYRLWTDRNDLQEKIKENARIYRLVRQSLLIADIMHDAIDDLVTARAQIDIVKPRIPAEELALSSAKKSLKELINASRHFRTFFSMASRTEEIVSLPDIRKVSAGNSLDTVNVHQIVEELRIKYERSFDKNKITLTNSAAASLEFKGIQYNIRRAIENALKNSISHLENTTHRKREILVTLRHVPAGSSPRLRTEHVEIVVEDNGVGVELEHLRRVTEPFFSRRGGMGLGLPIIQAACEVHGGRLDVHSEWGKGFSVVMSIPTEGTAAR